MIISVATGRELRPTELAVVGFFTGVSSHVHFEVALFEESQATVLALVVRYLIEVSVSLMEPKPRISSVGLCASWVWA